MFNATLSFILASKETRIRKKVQKDVFMYYLKKIVGIIRNTDYSMNIFLNHSRNPTELLPSTVNIKM